MKVDRLSLSDQIVVEIRRRIIAGELAEGMPLRQERLAAELGVSRVPLREAIRQLESEGLVKTELHKGTIVSSLSRAEIEELFEIRAELETWLFGLAIPLMTEVDFARAEQVTAEASAVARIDDWAELNWRFHSAICRPSGRMIAMRLLKTVHDNANRYVNLKLAVTTDIESELADHRRLLAFARVGDVAGGVALLRVHIRHVAESLIASIDEERRASGTRAGAA